MKPHKNRQSAVVFRHAFSLVELLVVMAILSILLVAAIPVFSNNSNRERQASREMIKGHLQQARAHAIASGTATALAIPTLAADPELGARAISLVEVENPAGKYLPIKDGNGKDRQLQRWGKLPANFYFLSSSQISTAQPTVLDSGDLLTVILNGKSLDCHIIVFSPNGQIVRPASGTKITLAIGQAADRNGSLTLTDKTGGSPVFDLLEINRLTGRTSFFKK